MTAMPERYGLQMLPHFVQVRHAARIEGHDQPALSDVFLKHAEDLEPREDITCDEASDTEMASEFELIHTRAAERRPVYDRALDLPVDLFPAGRLADGSIAVDEFGEHDAKIDLVEQADLVADDVTLAGNLSQHALIPKPSEHLPDRGATGAEKLHQLPLAHQRPDAQNLVGDRTGDDVIHLLVEPVASWCSPIRASMRCGRHAGSTRSSS